VLFIDELHRFNKAQQDVILPYVEDGTVTLIGATTENPSFEVIAPLLSRSRVIRLKQLEAEHLESVVERALRDPERGLGALGLVIDSSAVQALVGGGN
ncbi:MAG TPA: replication-associated recombination protein A, partial [Tepidiformaceae bacterium]|nr:replication-associated recombination protein A [Tepidiformaceae bacterium]